VDEPNSHVPDYVVELEGEELEETLENNVPGVTESKSSSLVDEYQNLATLCWATIYDSDYLQEEIQISGEYLRDQLQEEDLHISYYGEELHIPSRVSLDRVDIPLDGYEGRYDFHLGNVDEWLDHPEVSELEAKETRSRFLNNDLKSSTEAYNEGENHRL